MNINLTPGQIFAIILAVLGVLGASTAQLTDLLGATEAKVIVTISSLLSSILSTILAVITGQGSQIAAVQAMPGIEKITVNAQANSTLASLAVDPANDKIESLPSAASAVAATAKGA